MLARFGENDISPWGGRILVAKEILPWQVNFSRINDYSVVGRSGSPSCVVTFGILETP